MAHTDTIISLTASIFTNPEIWLVPRECWYLHFQPHWKLVYSSLEEAHYQAAGPTNYFQFQRLGYKWPWSHPQPLGERYGDFVFKKVYILTLEELQK